MSALCLAVDDGRAQALIEPAAPIYEIPREKVVSASSLDVIDPDPIVDALPLDVIVFVVADERVRAEGSRDDLKTADGLPPAEAGSSEVSVEVDECGVELVAELVSVAKPVLASPAACNVISWAGTKTSATARTNNGGVRTPLRLRLPSLLMTLSQRLAAVNAARSEILAVSSTRAAERRWRGGACAANDGSSRRLSLDHQSRDAHRLLTTFLRGRPLAAIRVNDEWVFQATG